MSHSCREKGEELMSYAFITRSSKGLLTLIKYGMDPCKDHSGVHDDTYLHYCLVKCLKWTWNYANEFGRYFPFDERVAKKHKRKTLIIFLILLFVVVPGNRA